MHEFSLVKKEVDLLKNKVKGKKISKIVFSLGRLSHGTPQSITEAFKTITADTHLASAQIDVLSIEPKVKCASCGELINCEGELKTACAACGSGSSEVIQGEECFISSVEVE